MYENAELKQKLEHELQWVQYRQKMLDIIEAKLVEMRKIAEQAKAENLTPIEIEALNNKINNLAEEVRAIDSESRRMEDGNILE